MIPAIREKEDLQDPGFRKKATQARLAGMLRVTSQSCSPPSHAGEHVVDQFKRAGWGQLRFQYPATRAFMWENGVMVELNDLIASNSGFSLVFGLFINDRGEIAGIGFPPGCVASDTDVCRHAYMLIPCEGRRCQLRAQLRERDCNFSESAAINAKATNRPKQIHPSDSSSTTKSVVSHSQFRRT